MKKLEQPRGLVINFSPSPRQYEVWKALQGGVCDKCGGPLKFEITGHDKQGHPIHEAVCSKCGNADIPELVLMGGSAGGGKAQTLDSVIVTPYGDKTVKDIKVGDIISNPDTGGTEKVIYLHPIESREYYRVHFIDGTHVDCSKEHLWQLHVAHKSSPKKEKCVEERGSERVWTTEMIFNWLHPEDGIKKNNLIIPLSKPVQFTVGGRIGFDIIINPYFLGCLIGNGCLTKLVKNSTVFHLTTMDSDMIDRLESMGYCSYKKDNAGKAYTYTYSNKEIADELHMLGLSGHSAIDKFIPEKYKYTTIENRKLIMQGLMDTDGYVDSRGHMSYSTISKRLAEDVAWIVRSLGGKATITEKIPHYTYKGERKEGQKAYNVWIMTKFDRDLVYVDRKKSRARNEFNGGVSELGKRITGCEYIGIKEGRCITVDNPSGLYITDNFTVTHNSYLGCAWVVSSCLQYPGIRMVLGRKELKNLIATTWATMLGTLNNWGLEQGVHYHINNQRMVLTFWNDSQIIGMDMAPMPSDPQYDRFGSLEISGAFIDEVAEIQEKAIEVLQSRIRYKIAESFMVGKMCMSCNPTQNWVKSTFVQDDDGNPIKLPRGLRYLPFSLFDNPNEQFRMIYFNRLRKIRDKATRQRLLTGDWDFSSDNKMAVYYNFDGEKHVVQGLFEKAYSPIRPLIISLDFNVNPYMSCLFIQFDWDEKQIFILKELTGKPEEGLNNAPAFGRFLANELKKMNHIGGVKITGDPAGLARSTQTERGVNNFTLIQKALDDKNITNSLNLFTTQPSQINRIDFINELFNGLNGWTIISDIRNRRLTEDFSFQMKNPDGTKEKKKVLMDDGTRAEKYGHLSDCFDYALCYYLSNDYNRFINGDADPITTISDSEIYGDFDY